MGMLQTILVCLAGTLVACSREEGGGEKSKVVITLPAAYSSMGAQSKMSSLSNDKIAYVAINVTGDKMNPIVYFWENCGECINGSTPPSTFEIDVPSGKNRLFQLLIVREDENSTSISYGDETLHAKGVDTELEIEVRELSNTSQVDGHIAGRYLTDFDSGPTGDVDVTFNPPGNKPAMVVLKEQIYNGWFKFRGLSNTKLSYRVRPTIPTQPSFEMWGGPKNLRDFTPNEQVARISFPVHQRKKTILESVVYIPEDAFILTAGFWADNSSLISGKKMCIHGFSSGGVPAQVLFEFDENENALAFKSSESELSDSQLLNTDSPSTEVRAKGGGTSSSCGSTVGDSEFVNKLWVRSSMLDGESKDSFMGFDGVFKYAQIRTSSMSRNSRFEIAPLGEGENLSFTVKVIPGLQGSFVNGLKFFKKELPDVSSSIMFPNCLNPVVDEWADMGSCSLDTSTYSCNRIEPIEHFLESTGVLVCAYSDADMTIPLPWASRMISPWEIPDPI